MDAVISVGGRSQLTGARRFTVIQVRVFVRNVLDLRDAATQAALGTRRAELQASWRLSPSPPTQRLGAVAAADARIGGLLAPSAKGTEEAVLVVFTDRLRAAEGTFCEVVDGGSLHQRLP